MFQAETKKELTAEKLHITALADTCNVTFYASLKSDFWKSIGHVLVFIFLNTSYSSMFFIFACKFNSKSLIFKRGFFFTLYYTVILTARVRFVFYVYFFPSLYGIVIHVFIYNRSTFLPNYASRNLLYWPQRNEKVWICANCYNCTATINLTNN